MTHVSASVLLQVLGRLEPPESLSPLLVDGLPEGTVTQRFSSRPDSRPTVQLVSRLTFV